MNTCPKLLVATIAIILLPWTAWASGKKPSISEFQLKQCEKASYGNLNLDEVLSMAPWTNSYLFDCAISAIVPFPDDNLRNIKLRNSKKQKIADFFISRDLDLTYTDETGSTLLMAVVVSFMPSNWKVKIVKILVGKGSNIQVRNNFKKTVIDLARFTKSPEIVKLLSTSTD